MGTFAAQSREMSTSIGRRLAAACLAVVIVVGSMVLWVGVPIAGFWAGGRLTTTAEGYLLFVLGVVPLSMVLVGWTLYRINALYEGLRQQEPDTQTRSAWLVSLSDERAGSRRRRSRRTLIDVAMATSAVTAMVVLVVWFFFFAHMTMVTWQ